MPSNLSLFASLVLGFNKLSPHTINSSGVNIANKSVPHLLNQEFHAISSHQELW